MIGVVPHDAIKFISEIYAGSISGGAVVESSGVVYTSAEDLILADRVFTIHDDLLPTIVTLNF